MKIMEKIRHTFRPYSEYTMDELKQSRKSNTQFFYIFTIFELLILVLAMWTIWNFIPVIGEITENMTSMFAIGGFLTACIFFLLMGFHWYYSIVSLHFAQKVDIIELFMMLKQMEKKL